MKAAARLSLERAAHAIRGARLLLEGDEPELAAGRGYYAMLYTAQSLLIEQGLQFKTHGSVHGLFGKHFAKTALLDPKYHRWMITAFDLRLEGD